uniref:Uncharacterized protein n=1 Tax=Amphiprion percula TaxID=161767 RepID=A0A3P8RQQ1_AMPPE
MGRCWMSVECRHSAEGSRRPCVLTLGILAPPLTLGILALPPLTLGILAPRSWYCLGFFRKLTNSMISSLASSQPATSLNLTSISSFRILAMLQSFMVADGR